MTRYQVIYVRRSDGRLEVVNKNRREKNQPTPDQMNRAPNSKGVVDYYKELAPDELKHLDWRRKLAGMLMNYMPDCKTASSKSILPIPPPSSAVP
jgi:hypothetical protein